MTNIKCPRCGYTKDAKSMARHFNRKNQCPAKLSEVDINSIKDSLLKDVAQSLKLEVQNDVVKNQDFSNDVTTNDVTKNQDVINHANDVLIENSESENEVNKEPKRKTVSKKIAKIPRVKLKKKEKTPEPEPIHEDVSGTSEVSDSDLELDDKISSDKESENSVNRQRKSVTQQRKSVTQQRNSVTHQRNSVTHQRNSVTHQRSKKVKAKDDDSELASSGSEDEISLEGSLDDSLEGSDDEFQDVGRSEKEEQEKSQRLKEFEQKRKVQREQAMARQKRKKELESAIQTELNGNIIGMINDIDPSVEIVDVKTLIRFLHRRVEVLEQGFVSMQMELQDQREINKTLTQQMLTMMAVTTNNPEFIKHLPVTKDLYQEPITSVDEINQDPMIKMKKDMEMYNYTDAKSAKNSKSSYKWASR
jgi:hypothetical protein